jgi:hypothetical protein
MTLVDFLVLLLALLCIASIIVVLGYISWLVNRCAEALEGLQASVALIQKHGFPDPNIPTGMTVKPEKETT